ncbi:MAG TPA: hypothetical protein VHR86_09970, partial [Armatimonadota bacterium]|nr:hypothetical protein [Armatimonadota bacterium]
MKHDGRVAWSTPHLIPVPSPVQEKGDSFRATGFYFKELAVLQSLAISCTGDRGHRPGAVSAHESPTFECIP